MHILFKPFAVLASALAVAMLAAAGLTAVAAQPAGSSSNAQQADGWNVVRAAYDGGIFQRTGANQWTEFVDDGRTFSFDELNRDAGSAFLYDPSRDVRIQIDVDRGLIMSAVRSEPLQNLYRMTGATAGTVAARSGPFAGVNGRNIIHAIHSRGVFAVAGNGEWLEEADGGQLFEFEEMQRDDWAVYLYDPSRDVHVQIDVPGQRILSAVGDEPWSFLYRMTDARTPE